MRLKVHLLNPPSPDSRVILEKRISPQVQLTYGEIPESADFQILVGGRPDRAQLEASPYLEVLIIPFAGIPEKTRALMADFPQVSVHNLHYNAAPTAEMALALLLTAAKFLVPIDRAFRNHDWEPRYGSNPSLLLDGKTCLILGLGHIGQRVALVCQALGMQVLGIRRNPGAPILPGLRMDVYPPEDLHQLLPRAEALIITLPLTSETENMIGENELELLPSGGLLVNVGRGKIVDQAALYHTLKDGRLAAAGLDVWYNYPQAQAERRSTPPADYPFHELDNLVMSPHRGGGSLESEKHRMESLAELINFASQNKSIPNRVDIEAGY